jgi:hypothetical protein
MAILLVTIARVSHLFSSLLFTAYQPNPFSFLQKPKKWLPCASTKLEIQRVNKELLLIHISRVWDYATMAQLNLLQPDLSVKRMLER